MAISDYYKPFLDMGKKIVSDALSGQRANPEGMVGVPNEQRDDPYPRFDRDAVTRRDIGAVAWGQAYGSEPKTAEELELASGVDRRIPDAPREWSAPTRIPGLGSYATTPDGGYAVAHGVPPPVREIAPRTPFADAPGQSFADTLASGRRAQAQQDALGLTTADMDYIRSYGRAAWEARNAKYAPPTTRADYLARQGQNLAISVAERNAAQQELSRIDAEQRRQDALAVDADRMAHEMGMAQVAARRPVVGGGVAVVPEGESGWRVERAPAAASAAGGPTVISGKDSGWLDENGSFNQNPLYEKPSETEAAKGKWKAEVQSLVNEGRLTAEQARGAARVEAAGIRADAQRYAADRGYEAAINVATQRVEAAKAAGLSDQQVAKIRAESEERVAKLSQDGALARAGIVADTQRYIADSNYAARADAAAAAVQAAEAGANARVTAERIRAEAERQLAEENPWVALGGGLMGNKRTGEQSGKPAPEAGAKPTITKVKGADGAEKIVATDPDGNARVVFEDAEAAVAIAEADVRRLKADRARFAFTAEQRADYDAQIAEAEERVKLLKGAKPSKEGSVETGGGWDAFGGLYQ